MQRRNKKLNKVMGNWNYRHLLSHEDYDMEYFLGVTHYGGMNFLAWSNEEGYAKTFDFAPEYYQATLDFIQGNNLKTHTISDDLLESYPTVANILNQHDWKVLGHSLGLKRFTNVVQLVDIKDDTMVFMQLGFVKGKFVGSNSMAMDKKLADKVLQTVNKLFPNKEEF